MIRRLGGFNQAPALPAVQDQGAISATVCGFDVVQESKMVRRIILGLLLVGCVALIYVGYKNRSARRSMLSGDVISGPSEPLPAGSPALPASQPTQRRPYPVPASVAPAAASGQSTAPASDSQAPDAPNGARFAGAGRYEVYRQGNLTYRVDTTSGQSCVLYATKEEWRKPEVYRHGCGNSAAQ